MTGLFPWTVSVRMYELSQRGKRPIQKVQLAMFGSISLQSQPK